MLFSAISLFALGVAAQSACTTTTTLRNRCCPPAAGVTETASVDCHGCSAIATRYTGPVCDIACPSPTPTDAASTATVAVCSVSPVSSSTILATSTSCTITSVQQVPFGCTVTEPASTSTALIDCSGCALTTVTTNRFGPGPVCVGGIKTVTGTSITTVTSCEPTPTPY